MGIALISAINANPVDQNLLQASTFQVTFSRLPYPTFFVQQANLPGISTVPPEQTTTFVTVPKAPGHMTYERFVMTFAVDEELWSWTSIQDWLKGMTIPDNFQEYRNLSLQQRLQMQSEFPQYSDAILTILSNKNNPILSVQFKDMFPISLSSIQFDTKQDASNIITATAVFAYATYYVNRQV